MPNRTITFSPFWRQASLKSVYGRRVSGEELLHWPQQAASQGPQVAFRHGYTGKNFPSSWDSELSQFLPPWVRARCVNPSIHIPTVWNGRAFLCHGLVHFICCVAGTNVETRVHLQESSLSLLHVGPCRGPALVRIYLARNQSWSLTRLECKIFNLHILQRRVCSYFEM